MSREDDAGPGERPRRRITGCRQQGQTAPGDGICIKKTDSDGNALDLSGTHDVIIRFLRIRAGNNTGQFRSESFRTSDSDNFIVDHCSCSWGNPETLSASGGALDHYTVQ